MNDQQPHVVLTDRYAQAVLYASTIHGTHVRKGTNISYLSHLLGVSSLVIEAGGDEDQAIAGLLHDAVEDAGGLAQAKVIRKRFGKRVTKIVLACSDSTDEEWKEKTNWKTRQQLYLDRIAEEPLDYLLVTIADKVHNSRAIVTDLQRSGKAGLDKFNAPDLVLWYYKECFRIALDRGVTDVLTNPLRLSIDRLREVSTHNPVLPSPYQQIQIAPWPRV